LVPRTAAADAIIGVTYFDTIAPGEFAEFYKAFICLFQGVSGNTIPCPRTAQREA
jgi:hypothetical protein